jgi:hypothetical protein
VVSLESCQGGEWRHLPQWKDYISTGHMDSLLNPASVSLKSTVFMVFATME